MQKRIALPLTIAMVCVTIGLVNIASASTTIGTDINTGGNLSVSGVTTLSSLSINSILSTNSTGIVSATSTPTFGYFNATSTTATSTVAGNMYISGNLNINGALFDINGNRYATSSSGGVSINGSSVSSPNFNFTTPAAEAGGYVNVKFQASGSSISAEVPPPSNVGSLTYNSSGTTTFNAGSAPIAGATVTVTNNTSTTFSPTNLVRWGDYTVEIIQDSTGGGVTFTLGTGGSCSRWLIANGGSGAIILSTAASAIDVLSFTFDGTNCVASFVPNWN